MTKDGMMALMRRGCAVAALLALPMGSGALAQDGQTGDQTQQPQQQAQDAQQQTEQAQDAQQQEQTPGTQQQPAGADAQQTQEAQGGQQHGQGQAGQPGGDVLVATVGDKEIRSSEVMSVVGMLPEPLRAQQPDMLVPIAVDQLILRELILQQAQEENLGADPDVQQLLQNQQSVGQEDAMVQVWLERELNERVTDQQVQQTYDRIAAGAAEGTEVPPIEAVRPEIEQQLRQQALGEIRASLHEGADITFYGPDGEPIQEGMDQGQPDAAPTQPESEDGGQEGQQPG